MLRCAQHDKLADLAVTSDVRYRLPARECGRVPNRQGTQRRDEAMTMRVFDHIEIDELDRRDRHLWLLAISMIVILGAGTALLMYPPVFGAPSDPSARMFQRIFVGFCALNSLFVVYLLERQVTIRRLRRRLIEEQRRNAELHAKASKDLIASLPNFAHFQDRLAMQFRRAVNSREPLSLLVVSLT